MAVDEASEGYAVTFPSSISFMQNSGDRNHVYAQVIIYYADKTSSTYERNFYRNVNTLQNIEGQTINNVIAVEFISPEYNESMVIQTIGFVLNKETKILGNSLWKKEHGPQEYVLIQYQSLGNGPEKTNWWYINIKEDLSISNLRYDCSNVY